MNGKRTNRIVKLLALAIFFLMAAVVSADTKRSNPESASAQPTIPQPQGFCGYCHILTYPAVINKNYETWKKGKHNNVGCAECHYNLAGVMKQPPITKPSSKGATAHIPMPPPTDFSYIKLGGETIKTRPEIPDASCMTSSCHGKPGDKFQTKKIPFTEKVPFVHQTHLDKKNQIEGMHVNCTSCHQHESDMKHFQVSEATCHLCHFSNTKFNQGRAKCELCHQLPTKPIQSSDKTDAKPITHQMMKEAEVSCISCHFDIVRGAGENKVEPVFENGVIKTVLFLSAGKLKEENCLVCHDQTQYLQKAGDKKEMHGRHVNAKNARCFDCHRPIEHRKAKIHDPLPSDCTTCHIEPHAYQRLLASGPERAGIKALPDPMFKARSNCLACHVEKEKNHKGQSVMKASAKTCVQCHTKDYEKMFDLWKRELTREIQKAEALETQALEALKKPSAQITQQNMKEAKELLESGRDVLNIVRFGNGIHNAKYSMALLDLTMADLKDAVSLLEGKELSGGSSREE